MMTERDVKIAALAQVRIGGHERHADRAKSTAARAGWLAAGAWSGRGKVGNGWCEALNGGLGRSAERRPCECRGLNMLWWAVLGSNQ